VRTRRADALFEERAILLDAACHRDGARDLIVLARRFIHEQPALALGTNTTAGFVCSSTERRRRDRGPRIRARARRPPRHDLFEGARRA
jgi:hypothetical protein